MKAYINFPVSMQNSIFLDVHACANKSGFHWDIHICFLDFVWILNYFLYIPIGLIQFITDVIITKHIKGKNAIIMHAWI